MKKIGQNIIFFIFAFILLFLGIGRLNSTKLKVEESRIYVGSIPNSFVGTKLVHISDFHIECDDKLSKLKKVVSEVADIEPDILIINGDFVMGNCGIDFDNDVAKELKPLDEIVWKFYTIGDEDKQSTKTILNGAEFTLLNNKLFTLYNKEGDALDIVGVYPSSHNIELKNSATTLLFSHQPDHLSNVDLSQVDIAFTAHTHVGKIYVPFYKGIISTEGASSIGYQPFEKVGGLEIYTSRGVATSGFQIRYFNDPTIHFYRLDNK